MKSKYITKLKAQLSFLLIGLFLAASCPSCTLKPETQARVLAFTDKVLAVGVLTGKLPPGSNVLIRQGVAVVVTPGSTEEKIFTLAELGLEEYVRQNQIKDGSVLEIKQTEAVVLPPPIVLGPSTPTAQ